MPPPPSSTSPTPPEKPIDKRKAARDVIDILHEISTLLTVIKDLRREGDAVRAQMGNQSTSDD
ncbi:MAG: hypothetical protein M1836_001500 [Candelina mexicana]|nr:MAG: hypothetical protein M1836_001500 [Candelina mexicana]